MTCTQVGGREFVDRALVEGTRREGYRLYGSLPAGFARAAFAMFLITEVHPFADGNGRIARVFMNPELTAAGQQRIIVTTHDRDDDLMAVRGMSTNANLTAYVSVLAELQQRTAAIDFSSLTGAQQDLDARHAFSEEEGATTSPRFMRVSSAARGCPRR